MSVVLSPSGQPRVGRKLPFILTFALLLLSVSPIGNAQEKDKAEFMREGHAQLLQADELAKRARNTIKKSSQLRKIIGRQQYQLQSLNEAEKNQMSALLDEQKQLLTEIQAAGSALRVASREAQSNALSLLKRGMQIRWREWIHFPGPLSSSDEAKSVVRAHNTPQRSVHPRMPEAKSDSEIRQTEDMSLSVNALSGQQLPEALNTESFSISRKRQVFAHIELIPEGGSTQVPINKLHQWRLILSSLDGEAVENATVLFGGHMPGHVHGLPTQPRVTDSPAPGVYTLSGLKFQMGGWWVIELTLGEGAQADSVRFNVVL